MGKVKEAAYTAVLELQKLGYDRHEALDAFCDTWEWDAEAALPFIDCVYGEEPFSKVPNELCALKQWVLWKRVPRGKKDAKAPYQTNGQMARTNDSRTWATFADAVSAFLSGGYDGIGFVFTENDPYCGVDLDHCIVDGMIEPWAADILKQLKSYTEYSPSETGLHIIGKGKKPTDKCRKGALEVYERGRYFTITGKVRRDTIRDVQQALNEICAEL